MTGSEVRRGGQARAAGRGVVRARVAGLFLVLAGAGLPALGDGTGVRIRAIRVATNGVTVEVAAPAGTTNRVDLFRCTHLVSNDWNVAVSGFPMLGNDAVALALGPPGRFAILAAGDADDDGDADGLADMRELLLWKTDPGRADTDADGMGDGWELAYGLNPHHAADAGEDPDGDGATNAEEYRTGRRPQAGAMAADHGLKVLTPLR